MKDFIGYSNNMVAWKSEGDRKNGMYNIVLRGEKPFCALIGFKMVFPIVGYIGYDYYGFVKADSNNIAVVSPP
jgi:hypothetical protein